MVQNFNEIVYILKLIFTQALSFSEHYPTFLMEHPVYVSIF